MPAAATGDRMGDYDVVVIGAALVGMSVRYAPLNWD